MRVPRAQLVRLERIEAAAKAHPEEWWQRLPIKIVLWIQYAHYMLRWITDPELDEWEAVLAAVESGERTLEDAHDQVTRILAKAEARRDVANEGDHLPTFFRELEREQRLRGA